MIKIFDPFQNVTEVISTEKFLSISSVKPILYKLLEKISKINIDDKTLSYSESKESFDDINQEFIYYALITWQRAIDLKDDENENQAEGSNSDERLAKRPKKSNDSQKS